MDAKNYQTVISTSNYALLDADRERSTKWNAPAAGDEAVFRGGVVEVPQILGVAALCSLWMSMRTRTATRTS